MRCQQRDATRLALLALALVGAGARADYMDHFVVRDDVGPHKAPSLGKAELLVIPVEVKGFRPFDRAALERFFSPDDPKGFVQYYETASLHRYHPHVTVAQTVVFDTCPLPEAEFPGCAVKRADLGALLPGLEMIREVVRRARALGGFTFGQLDVNGVAGQGDGWADGVMILTNSPFGGIALPFGFYNTGDNLNGGTGGPMIVDGTRVGHVAIGGSGNAHVLVHEFGHLLGLTDLYAESNAYRGLDLSVMGSWPYDDRIPLPDAETRYRLRWGNWHQVASTRTVVVQPAETSGEVWRLGTGKEYWLVENRGPGVFDGLVTTRGLALFHVDRTVKLAGEEGRFQDRSLNPVNDDPWRSYIMWVQADGAFHVQHDSPPDWEFDLFRDGDAWGPSDDTAPFSGTHTVFSSNTYAGAKTGLGLHDVKVRPDGAIEVTFEAPTDGQCDERLCDQGEGCAPVSCQAPPTTPPKSGCGTVLLPPVALLALAWGRRRRVSAS